MTGAYPGQPGLIVDLFAGPGGWSTGMRALGLWDVGVEWDAAACRTRVGEGHLTVQADVSALDPAVFGEVWGAVLSPPCQAWSMAGVKGGRPDAFIDALAGRYDNGPYLERMRAAIAEQKAARTAWDEDWAAIASERGWLDENGRLTPAGAEEREFELGPEPVVEDERGWLMAESVRWLDAMRPVWVVCEQVPPVLPMWQALAVWLRERGYSAWAGVVNAADYGVPQTRERAVLLARRDGVPVVPPEPTHTEHPEGDDLFGVSLLPWTSMADALGWDGDDLVGFPRREEDGSGRYRDRDLRRASKPAWGVTSKVRCWSRATGPVPAGSVVRTAFGEPHRGRAVGSPKPEFDPYTRPSRTVVTKVSSWSIVPSPSEAWLDAAADGRVLRLEPWEWSVLQSFPPGYKFTGSSTKQSEQVGNSVPPVLAARLVAAVTGRECPEAYDELVDAFSEAEPASVVAARAAALPVEAQALLTPQT